MRKTILCFLANPALQLIKVGVLFRICRNGRPQGHPEFNPRTLHVPKDFLDNKKFCTPAGRQWWEFKSQNMDTLLCFKVRMMLC